MTYMTVMRLRVVVLSPNGVIVIKACVRVSMNHGGLQRLHMIMNTLWFVLVVVMDLCVDSIKPVDTTQPSFGFEPVTLS
jgi:hypothetical protein